MHVSCCRESAQTKNPKFHIRLTEKYSDFRMTSKISVVHVIKQTRRISVMISLMSRIERKYCSISTSYLVGISDIFILLHI